MTLYVPGGTENTITDTYLRQFWSQSCGYSGCDCPQFRMDILQQPGWHTDPAWNECTTKYCCGGHGGCPSCIMTQSQVIADYHTEVTFMSSPPGALIFIDGTEWWPGAVTAADGATFRGVPPAADPTPHTYELRMAGYRSATGTFGLALDTPITVTGNLVPLGIRAISIVPDVTTCTAPCDVTIEVIWTNDAVTDMEFVPSLMIDGIPIDPAPYPPEILLAGTNVTHAFLVSGLTAGTYNICASPDSGTCVTVNVLTPANVISATLTVDTNDCVAPCTVNGTVSWTNNGGTISVPTDLAITFNGGSTIVASGAIIGPGETTAVYPFTISNLVAGTYAVQASPNAGTAPQTITVRTPANVISATLTVDTNDCVAPCTVNGTVSWTNTGGTGSAPIDLSIIYNGTSTTVASAVVIGPGETTAVYPFTISNLVAGTYAVQASPNAGTAPQTITVRTPANIIATAITPSVTTCIEPCDLTVDITWVNNGQMIGTFTPKIVVNGASTPLIPENLDPGQPTTKRFPLTGLTVGTYNICADPNTLTCATVTVERAAAGGGAGMLFGLVGLAALGMMITSKKKE